MERSLLKFEGGKAKNIVFQFAGYPWCAIENCYQISAIGISW